MNEEEILLWIANGGNLGDIFGSGTDSISPMPFLESDADNEADYVNDRFTTFQKGNNIYADEMTRIMLGASPGGFGPETFKDKVSYESVKAPAYLKLKQMENSNDPVSRIIADVFLNQGGNGFDAENQILKAMEPGSPFYDELANMPALWETTSRPGGAYGDPVPNTSRVRQITDQIDQLALNDPIFNALDEGGLPANIVDENGNVISRSVGEDGAESFQREIREQGVGAAAYERLGFKSPYEPYHRDTFADSSTLEAEDRRVRALERAQNEYLLAQASHDETYGGLSGTLFDLAERVSQNGLDKRQADQEEFSLYGDTLTPAVREDGGGSGPQSNRTDGRPLSVTKTMRSGGAARDAADHQNRHNTVFGGRNDRSRESQTGVNLSKADMYNASARSKVDMYKQRDRDAFVRYLSQQGFNPYNEQMRDLQQQVYGR